jgi:hypothetical protein
MFLARSQPETTDQVTHSKTRNEKCKNSEIANKTYSGGKLIIIVMTL